MTKRRSRAYPGVSLGVACSLLREKLKDLGSAWTERKALAAFLGYQTGEGGVAARKVAALVHFGLLERSEKGYRLSDAGKKIQEFAEDSPEFLASARSALKKPALFAGILTRFHSGERIPRQELRRVLTDELGITEQAREDAVEVFVESARFARLIDQDGRLLELGYEASPAPEISPSTSAAFKRLEILLRGKSAWLEFPISMDRRDLKALVDNMSGVVQQIKSYLQMEDLPEIVPMRGSRATLHFPRPEGD
jgi:hypothetical protein